MKDKKTREPLAPFNGTSEPMGKLGRFFREDGLYTFVRWNTFFTNPPLCITEDELRQGFDIIDRGLTEIERTCRMQGESGLRRVRNLQAGLPDESGPDTPAAAIAAATSFVVAFPPRSGVRGPPSPSTRSMASTMRVCALATPR